MFLYIPRCYSVHLCSIVQEGHAALPIYLYLGLHSPYHTTIEKGLDSRRESARMILHLLSLLLGALGNIGWFQWGSVLPSLLLSPPSCLTASCPQQSS